MEKEVTGRKELVSLPEGHCLKKSGTIYISDAERDARNRVAEEYQEIIGS